MTPDAPPPRTWVGRQLDALTGSPLARVILGAVLTAALAGAWAAGVALLKDRTGVDVPLAPPVIELDVYVPGESPDPDHAALSAGYDGLPYEAAALHAACSPGGPCPEAVEANGRRWPADRLTYWIDWPSAGAITPNTRAAIREEFRAGWAAYTGPLALEAVEVDTAAAAVVRHRFGRIDGPYGTLAWSYLADGTLRPKEQLYDTGERWATGGKPVAGRLVMRAVIAHENGHVLGLGHDDRGARSLLEPTYSDAVLYPTARDILRLVGLGYRRR